MTGDRAGVGGSRVSHIHNDGCIYTFPDCDDERGAPMADATVLDRAAEALRLSRFALEQASVGLLAFGTPNPSVNRDIERCRAVMRLIDGVLPDLPPEPPLTPEREAQVREVIGRVLDTFDA